MARNRISLTATPEEVFEVLADPFRYPEWVLGTAEVVDADGSWPKVGSSFMWRSGRGPVAWSGATEVLEADPPRRLVLRTTLPIGPVKIDLEIHPDGAGSSVILTEIALFPPLRHPLEPAFHVRNTFTLPSFKAHVEGSTRRNLSPGTLEASGHGGHWLDHPAYEEILTSAERCYLAVSTKSGPHVTPIAFSSSSGRIWIVTERSSLKARMIRRDPKVAALVRSDRRAVVVSGRATVFDPLRPWTLGPIDGLLAVPGLSRYLVAVAGRLGGILKESPTSVAQLNPAGRVLISIAPDRLALVDGAEVVDRRGAVIGSEHAEHGTDLPDASGRTLDLDEAPPDVAELADSGRVPAVLGWESAFGIVALPAHWHPERDLASVPSILLDQKREGPASLCLDSDEGDSLDDQKGLLVRGRGRVVAAGDGYAAVAIEQEKTTVWAAAGSATDTGSG